MPVSQRLDELDNDLPPPQAPAGLYNPVVIHGDTAYGAWRDGGLVIMDVSDRSKPKLIKHHNWSPPFGGGTHNCLPLPDRDLLVVADEAVLDSGPILEEFLAEARRRV